MPIKTIEFASQDRVPHYALICHKKKHWICFRVIAGLMKRPWIISTGAQTIQTLMAAKRTVLQKINWTATSGRTMNVRRPLGLSAKHWQGLIRWQQTLHQLSRQGYRAETITLKNGSSVLGMMTTAMHSMETILKIMKQRAGRVLKLTV